MFKKFRKNEKGFTLAELLIVVAIIGVLVAISIPIFTAQLEKSRDAVTLANLRAAYAEAQTVYLTAAGKDTTETDGKQTITYTAANNTVTVSNVVSKGTADGLPGSDELPFNAEDLKGKDSMGGNAKSTWTVTFTYTVDAKGNVTDIKATATAAK